MYTVTRWNNSRILFHDTFFNLILHASDFNFSVFFCSAMYWCSRNGPTNLVDESEAIVLAGLGQRSVAAIFQFPKPEKARHETPSRYNFMMLTSRRDFCYRYCRRELHSNPFELLNTLGLHRSFEQCKGHQDSRTLFYWDVQSFRGSIHLCNMNFTFGNGRCHLYN